MVVDDRVSIRNMTQLLNGRSQRRGVRVHFKSLVKESSNSDGKNWVCSAADMRWAVLKSCRMTSLHGTERIHRDPVSPRVQPPALYLVDWIELKLMCAMARRDSGCGFNRKPRVCVEDIGKVPYEGAYPSLLWLIVTLLVACNKSIDYQFSQIRHPIDIHYSIKASPIKALSWMCRHLPYRLAMRPFHIKPSFFIFPICAFSILFAPILSCIRFAYFIKSPRQSQKSFSIFFATSAPSTLATR